MKFGLVSLGKNRINSSAFGGLCLVAFASLGPFGQGRNTKSTEEGNSEKHLHEIRKETICNAPMQPIQDGPLPVIHGLKTPFKWPSKWVGPCLQLVGAHFVAHFLLEDKKLSERERERVKHETQKGVDTLWVCS